MSEYYTRQTTRKPILKKKSSYKKTFIKQLIFSLICFILIKYIAISNFSYSDSVKYYVKSVTNHNTDLSFISNISNNIKLNIKNMNKDTKTNEQDNNIF